jgi:hypothetical protein
MFKNVVQEYEKKNNYLVPIPGVKEDILDHLNCLFPTPKQGDFQGKTNEMDDLFKKIAMEVDPNIFSGQKTIFWKKFIFQKISSNSFVFEKIIDKLKVTRGKFPTATEWESVIVKRGNYELAEGFNYQAQVIGFKIAKAIREQTKNYTDEFKMPGDDIPLNEYWTKLLFKFGKKTKDKPKTDIILGDHKISLKKKGESQIFSGYLNESYALITYAMNKYIEQNEESIVDKIDALTKKFENDESFKRNNNYSAYLLSTFSWPRDIKNFVKMNKETFKHEIRDKATVILKTLSADYYKVLKKKDPKLTDIEFKNKFVDNIQKIWYDNLDDMSILQQIASNTDMPSDEDIFKVEELLTDIRKNYLGDAVKSNKKISVDSFNKIKENLKMSSSSKLEEYTKYVNAKKQFQISTNILNKIFKENIDIKKNIIYEGMSGDFKFNNNIGAANYICVFDTTAGTINYNKITMEYIDGIKDKFDIRYTFKSDDDIAKGSRAALRAYYKEEFDLLNFYSINENFVLYLKNKYKSFSRALTKILLSKIRKILKNGKNKIDLLSKLFKSKISKKSIVIKENFL